MTGTHAPPGSLPAGAGSEAGGVRRRPQVNDFALRIATVNGSGSASVNRLLMRTMFRMGVPVSGKNLFPSNIEGLPTWYEIRANGAGHTARTAHHDLVVAMNTQTYRNDIGDLDPGGYVLYDSTSPLPDELKRDDLEFLPIPLARMCIDHFPEPRQRILMRNIAYAGALVALLALDYQVVADLVDETFFGDDQLRDANQAALQLGYQYALKSFSCPLPFHAEQTNALEDHILVDGNTATALGCLYAGAVVGAWYPITPATSVMEAFARLCNQYRRVDDPNGSDGPGSDRDNYLILQAEDELAACGMVIGASWAGARAFAPTSGPGISLMNELLGLAYYTEIPAVIVDVQRAGPSTGMPTRTQQADILACAYASHGDTKHLLLFPADPGECFEFAVRSFDLAERFQTPVIVLSDLDIGLNDWVVPRLGWDDDYRPDRGRVLGAADLEGITEFLRYASADTESVTARTLPGVSAKGAYFTRGSGHDKFGHYTEAADAYQEVVDRLARKHRMAAQHMPTAVIQRRPGAKLAALTVGSCDQAVREALQLLSDDGIPLDYLRVRGFPFGPEVKSFIDEHDRCFVVEQNRDAQLRTLLVLEAGAEAPALLSVLSYGGMPLDARQVAQAILRRLEDTNAVD